MEYSHYSFNIKKIILKNYKKFDNLSIELNESITAITAPNAGGKSAVLQALAVGCAHFVNSVEINPGTKMCIQEDDHRLIPQKGGGMAPVSEDASIECEGTIGNEHIEWKRERSSKKGAKTRIANAKSLQNAARRLRSESQKVDEGQTHVYPIAPLIAYYDTSRLNRESKLTEKRKAQKQDRFEGYLECLCSGSYIRIFKKWFRDLSYQIWQESESLRQRELSPDDIEIRSIHMRQRDIVVQAVNEALEYVGWGNLKWDSIKNSLTLEHKKYGRLCIEQLSDGIRNILNLVTDIAHRAVKLNPLADENLLSEIQGLVIIDEIDMYLHPGWQQRIVSVFRDIFPKVQFVISSHSPQVLSTLKKEQIRLLYEDEDGNHHAEYPEESPYARSAAEALGVVFDVNPVPEVEESKEILDLELLYRDGKTKDADKLRTSLQEKGVVIPQCDVDFWKIIAETK